MIPYAETLSRHWLPVCRSADVGNEPLALRLLGDDIVAFRNKKGEIGVLLDKCPHRNVPLSGGAVTGDCLRCPYHGWSFDRNGQCRDIPGLPADTLPPYKAAAFAAQERAGLVWVRRKPPEDGGLHDLNIPPYLESDQYDTRLGEARARCGLLNALENFLDGTHTHFVHTGLIRAAGPRHAVDATLNTTKTRVSILYENEPGQNGIISRLFEPKRKNSRATFSLPCVATLEYNDDKGAYFSASAFMVPEDNDSLKIFSAISYRKDAIPGALKHFFMRPLFAAVLRQDIAVLERQQKCIDRAGGESFIIAPQDLMRRHLHRLLSGDVVEEAAKKTTLML